MTHEMGVEYTEAFAVLLKRISSRMWDRDVSDIAVDRARQAVRDRTTLHWVSGRQIAVAVAVATSRIGTCSGWFWLTMIGCRALHGWP